MNSWLGNQATDTVSAATASLREALAAYAAGARLRLSGARWRISIASG